MLLGDASRHGHALIDRALCFPKEWAEDADRRRDARAPEAVAFTTEPKLGPAMLERARVAGGNDKGSARASAWKAIAGAPFTRRAGDGVHGAATPSGAGRRGTGAAICWPRPLAQTAALHVALASTPAGALELEIAHMLRVRCPQRHVEAHRAKVGAVTGRPRNPFVSAPAIALTAAQTPQFGCSAVVTLDDR